LADYITLNLGQTKTPYCYDNYYNPFTLITVSRTLLDLSLSGRVLDLYGNQQGRDIGFWLNGVLHNAQERKILEYTLGVFNGAGIAIADNNNQKDFGGAVRFSPFSDLWISGRFYTGTGETIEFADVPTGRKRYGGDISYKRNKVLLEAEYLFGEDSSDSLGTLLRSGWYLTGGYWPIENKLQCTLRLDTFNGNLDVSDYNTFKYVAAANWFFTKFSRIQLEYSCSDVGGSTKNLHQFILQLQAGF
ncbi:MAG: porin, partial [Chitinophagales bacterium]